MIKNKLLVAIALLLLCLDVKGQPVENISGTAASSKSDVSKGDAAGNLIGVDHYTGTGSATIPIYSYETEGINLGVSLSYSFKGIRVDELASSVGLGWNLNAGLDITREVNGLEDEITTPMMRYAGTVYDTVTGVLVPGANDAGFINGFDDKDYDVFHINLGGRSVTFSYNVYGQIVTYPQMDITIQPVTYNAGEFPVIYQTGIKRGIGADPENNLLGFIITDDRNNKFYFRSGDAQYKSYDLGSGFFVSTGSCWATQRWVIEKIVTGSGQVINFGYSWRALNYQESQYESYDREKIPHLSGTMPQTVVNDPVEIKKEFWSGRRFHLSNITYPNGIKAVFKLSGLSRCDCENGFILTGIEIEGKYDASHTGKIEYKLNHSYFTTPAFGRTATTSTTAMVSCAYLFDGMTFPSGMDVDSLKEDYKARGSRLKLDNIMRITALEQEHYYDFEYNFDHALPYRFSPSKDYYGYYNAQSPIPFVRPNFYSGNDTFYLGIPKHTDTGSYVWGVDRWVHHTAIKAFMLKKILSVNGGEFEVECTAGYTVSNPDSSYGYWPNGINYYVDPDLEGSDVNDGLVVSKVFQRDKYHSQSNQTTQYNYYKGERFNRGGYTSYGSRWGGVDYHVLTNNFINKMDFVNGSNHGFSEVLVRSYGAYNEQLSCNRFTFSNLMYKNPDGSNASSMHKLTGSSYRSLPGDFRKFRMGMLLKVESMDKDWNILSKTENEYDDHVYAVDNRKSVDIPYPVNSGVGSYSWRLHDNEMARLVKTTKTRYVVDGTTKSMETVYLYDYDFKSNLKATKWQNSTGETFKKYKKYNYDYHNQYGGGFCTALDTMAGRNMVELLSSETWKYNPTFTDSVLLSFSITPPYYDGGENIIRYPATFSSLIPDPLSSGSIFPGGSASNYIDRGKTLNFKNYSGYGSSIRKNKETLRYDAKGNKLEVEVAESRRRMSYIYDLHIDKPIAQVNGAKYNEIAYTSFEGIMQPLPETSDKGNWVFDPNNIINALYLPGQKAMTGMKGFQLLASRANDLKNFATPNKYLLSFWVSSTSVPAVQLSSTMTGGGIPPVSVSPQLINTVGNWKLYTAEFDLPNTRAIEIANSTSNTMYIDEVRLHPVGAEMLTYTYHPLYGVKTATDGSNYTTYYEYDRFGRRAISRDMRGNIVELKETKYDFNGTYNPNQPPVSTY